MTLIKYALAFELLAHAKLVLAIVGVLLGGF